MATVNLPTASAKIIGDASGLVSELKRAEQQTSISAAKIDADVNNLVNRLERRFSLAHFGTDLLRGLGIGTGFALAQKGAEIIADHWKAAAEYAKAIDESSEHDLNIQRQIMALRQTDEQKLASLQKIHRDTLADLAAAGGTKLGTILDFDPLTGLFDKEVQITRDWTDEEVKLYKSLRDRAGNELLQLAILQKKISDDNIKNVAADAKAVEDATDRKIAAHDKELARIYKEVDDQTEAHQKYMDFLEKQSLEINQKMDADEKKGLTPVIEKTKKASDAARELGMTFSSAFEDAIVGGKEFSEVLRGLAQDILRMIVRQSITQPMATGIANMFASMFSGKAEGGAVSAGSGYMVGESGPEFFSPGQNGSIIPNGALRAAGGGGGGDVYNIDARGADRTGLARLEAMIRATNASINQRAITATADYRRRSAAAA